ALARESFLAVAEIAGAAAQGRIVLGAPITLDEIEQAFVDRIETRDHLSVDDKTASLRLRRTRELGALVLSEQPMRVEPNDDTARMLAQAAVRTGIDKLPWGRTLLQLRERVAFLRRAEGNEWPDLSEAALAAHVMEWLEPALISKTSLSELTTDELDT